MVGLAPCFRDPPGPEHDRRCDLARAELYEYTIEVARLLAGIIVGRAVGPMP